MKKIISIRELKEIESKVGFTDEELSKLITFYNHQVEAAEYFGDRPYKSYMERQLNALETFRNQRLQND